MLVLGIRENTLVTRAATYDRNIDALNATRTENFRDYEVARRWLAFQNGDVSELDEVEKIQLEFQISVVFQLYEKAYFNHRYGILDDSQWTRYDRQICVQWERVQPFPDYERNLRSVLTDEFFEYVESICAAPI